MLSRLAAASAKEVHSARHEREDENHLAIYSATSDAAAAAFEFAHFIRQPQMIQRTQMFRALKVNPARPLFGFVTSLATPLVVHQKIDDQLFLFI